MVNTVDDHTVETEVSDLPKFTSSTESITELEVITRKVSLWLLLLLSVSGSTTAGTAHVPSSIC